MVKNSLDMSTYLNSLLNCNMIERKNHILYSLFGTWRIAEKVFFPVSTNIEFNRTTVNPEQTCSRGFSLSAFQSLREHFNRPLSLFQI